MLLAELVELGRQAWRITEPERPVRAQIEALREAQETSRTPMPDTHTVLAQEVDRHVTDRMAAIAAAKAKRLWPNVIGKDSPMRSWRCWSCHRGCDPRVAHSG